MTNLSGALCEIISANISTTIFQIEAMNNKNITEKVNKHAFPKNKIFQIRCSKKVLHDGKVIN